MLYCVCSPSLGTLEKGALNVKNKDFFSGLLPWKLPKPHSLESWLPICFTACWLCFIFLTSKLSAHPRRCLGPNKASTYYTSSSYKPHSITSFSSFSPCLFLLLLFFFFLSPWSRPQSYWLNHFQSLLYCSENNQLGTFSEELQSCSCRYEHSPCQLPTPCSIGEGAACTSCAPDNHTRCASCNPGFALTQGACRPMVADSTENYLGFETDLQDLELGYLLQRADRRLEVFLF